MSKNKRAVEIIEATGSEAEDDTFVKPLDKGYKDIGVVSAIGLIMNRMLGTGIFATPATIWLLCGQSVGLSLIIWVVGAFIALAGQYVYLEFGSAIPRNGGEKNYLEYVYHKPQYLVSSAYGLYALALPWAAGNSVVFGTYILVAAGKEPSKWAEKGLGLAAISFAFIINSVHIKTGAYIQNVLGVFKIGVVLFITVTGWVALGGWKKTNNFHDSFATAKDATAYGVVNALYNVIWSFIGYSNVNYALGEVRNPVKTLKWAAPISLIGLAIVYIFVNIAYFAIVPKETLLTSKTILAADFFGIAFGAHARKASAVFVALSALGNVMSVIFSQGRIVNQLGREGTLPFSRLFASSKPFNSPMVGLFEHWFVVTIFIVASSQGDAYNLVINLISYPLNIINLFVGIGLLYLNIQAKRGKIEWKAPIKATIPVTVFFTLSSLYLVVAPYVPPDEGQSVYEHLPYYLHCVIAWGIFAGGAFYWLLWFRLFPKIFKYTLHGEEKIGSDGFWRKEFKIIKNDDYEQYITENAGSDSLSVPVESKESNF